MKAHTVLKKKIQQSDARELWNPVLCAEAEGISSWEPEKEPWKVKREK